MLGNLSAQPKPAGSQSPGGRRDGSRGGPLLLQAHVTGYFYKLSQPKPPLDPLLGRDRATSPQSPSTAGDTRQLQAQPPPSSWGSASCTGPCTRRRALLSWPESQSKKQFLPCASGPGQKGPWRLGPWPASGHSAEASLICCPQMKAGRQGLPTEGRANPLLGDPSVTWFRTADLRCPCQPPSARGGGDW